MFPLTANTSHNNLYYLKDICRSNATNIINIEPAVSESVILLKVFSNINNLKVYRFIANFRGKAIFEASKCFEKNMIEYLRIKVRDMVGIILPTKNF